MKFTIYQITNTVTQKSYIGYTKLDIFARWNQHHTRAFKLNEDTKFYNSIRKHGIDVWQLSEIEVVDSPDQAKTQEIYHIRTQDTYYSGYNSTKGGDGNNGIKMSKESNDKRSKKLKGVPKSDETVAKFRARRSTKESNDKRSKSHTGMKKPWVKWTSKQIEKRAMTRRAITKEQHDKVLEMRAAGLKIAEIAEITGLSCDMVKKWSKRSWDLGLNI